MVVAQCIHAQPGNEVEIAAAFIVVNEDSFSARYGKRISVVGREQEAALALGNFLKRIHLCSLIVFAPAKDAIVLRPTEGFTRLGPRKMAERSSYVKLDMPTTICKSLTLNIIYLN